MSVFRSMIVLSRTLQHSSTLGNSTLSPSKQSSLFGKSGTLNYSEAFFQAQQLFFSAVPVDSNVDAKSDIRLRMIRLSKRMSELDICSRREADRLIMDGRVLVEGRVAEIGGKVLWNTAADQIEILSINTGGEAVTPIESGATSAAADRFATTRSIKAVVLNKPLGFVSGQAEHGNTPAIRLLTRENLWMGSSIGINSAGFTVPKSWTGFAPAGRLDLDSTGLLVFTNNGVVAKKIISAESQIEKEYVVDVTPAIQETRRERDLDPSYKLPKPTLDLTSLLDGGRYLLEASERPQSPLKPCVQAEWIVPGEKLLVVVTEGRKHHVRRMCREFIGWHVTNLQRVRIGPVALEELPVGLWRPLRQEELDGILKS